MSYDSGHIKQREIDPTTLGLNAVTGAAERTSSNLFTRDYNQLTLTVHYTRSAGTKITIVPEHSMDSGTTWVRVGSEAVSAGAATVTPFQWERTTSVTENFSVSLGLNYKLMRFRITVTAGAAADLLTCYAMLGSL